MKQRWIRWLCWIPIVCWLSILPVSAAETNTEWEETAEAILEEVGWDFSAVTERLPQAVQEELDGLGVEDPGFLTMTEFSPSQVLSSIGNILAEFFPDVLQRCCGVFTVFLLCAMLQSMELFATAMPMGKVLSLVAMLCLTGLLLPELTTLITDASVILQGSAYFLLGTIPLLLVFLLLGGKAAGAGLGSLLLTVCNGISFLGGSVVVPVLNLMLGFSSVSALAPELQLEGLCKSCFSVLKWILGLAMTIFSTLLTMQGLLGSAAVTTNRTVRYLVSSFVPVIGNALGEAFGTIHTCAGILRNGLGGFGILAILLLFLPGLLRCLFWKGFLALTAGVGDLFGLSVLSRLLRSFASVVSLLMVLLLCTVVMLTVSLEVLMAMGGTSG